MSDKVNVKVGDMVSWGLKWESGKNGAAGSYVSAHLGEIKSLEGRGIATVEERREHKRTGKFLGTKMYRPYVSQLTVTARSNQSIGN